MHVCDKEINISNGVSWRNGANTLLRWQFEWGKPISSSFFWCYTEPRTSSTEPSVDSVVVRFRWVKSRPCFAREIHLISSLVSIFNPHSEQTCNLRNFFFQSSTLLYVINTLMWLSGSRHEITDHESFVYFHFSVVVFSWLLLLEFWFSLQRSS